MKASGFCRVSLKLVKDQVRFIAYCVHREISHLENRVGESRADMIDTWRKYLAMLFEEKALYYKGVGNPEKDVL